MATGQDANLRRQHRYAAHIWLPAQPLNRRQALHHSKNNVLFCSLFRLATLTGGLLCDAVTVLTGVGRCCSRGLTANVGLRTAPTWLNQESLFNVLCCWEITQQAAMFQKCFINAPIRISRWHLNQSVISTTFRFSFIRIIPSSS